MHLDTGPLRTRPSPFAAIASMLRLGICLALVGIVFVVPVATFKVVATKLTGITATINTSEGPQRAARPPLRTEPQTITRAR